MMPDHCRSTSLKNTDSLKFKDPCFSQGKVANQQVNRTFSHK